jgi:hypothetical protein
MASPSNFPSSLPNTKGSTSQATEPLPTYTLIIRAPFPRPVSPNGTPFTDPPPITWSPEKDTQLWSILSSQPSNQKNINWEELAADFGVDLGFLLQQAAWLYERQFDAVREQLRRVGGGATAAKVEKDGSVEPEAMVRTASGQGKKELQRLGGGEPMARTGSGGSVRKAPTQISPRIQDTVTTTGSRPGSAIPGAERDHASPRVGVGSFPPRVAGLGLDLKTSKLPMSRNSSAGTVQPRQYAGVQTQSGQGSGLALRSQRSLSPVVASRSHSNRVSAGGHRVADATRGSKGHSSSEREDSPDDDDDGLPMQSRLLRGPRYNKRPIAHKQRGGSLYRNAEGDEEAGSDADADDDEDSPTFLPFANPSNPGTSSSTTRPRGGTLRGQTSRQERDNEREQAQNQSSTLRGELPRASPLPKRKDTADTERNTPTLRQSQTSDSSASSTQRPHPVSHRHREATGPHTHQQPPGLRHLSSSEHSTGPAPAHRTAQLRSPAARPARPGVRARLSSSQHLSSHGPGNPVSPPIVRATHGHGSPAHAHGQSHGIASTPTSMGSMGSSFSDLNDLEDGSVTKSALEEALASQIRMGGGSKISNLSAAFRSRYL